MKPRTRRSADIALIELLRPDHAWPWPYSIEMAFQALRYLIASASGGEYVTQHQWYRSCAVGLMGGAGAENGGCRPVMSLADLRSRFHSALLARDFDEVARWRADKGIHVDAVINMAFRHYKPLSPPSHLPWRSENDIRKTVVRLLEESGGQRLTHQLNSIHKAAKVIHRVDVIVDPAAFHIVLRYGFKKPSPGVGDSEWAHSLAVTEGDEPFLDTLARAVTEFERVTAPVVKAPIKSGLESKPSVIDV